MLKAVFFDLDGTLLPMDEKEFTNVYFSLMAKKMKAYGYDKDSLVDCIWKGTGLMYKNDGSKSNEEVFWDYFVKAFGEDKLKDKELFNDFYNNEFKQTKACCKENPLAKDIVKFVKDNNLLCVLSTNPIFPYHGTLQRVGFINLSENDFDYITAYENSRFTKPNPLYFKDLLDKYNLKPEEVILFGNNELEDYICAKKLGIKCYLVGEYIMKHNLDNSYEHINMDQVIDKIKENLNN